MDGSESELLLLAIEVTLTVFPICKAAFESMLRFGLYLPNDGERPPRHRR